MPHTPHTPPDSLLQKYLDIAPGKAIAKYWAMCEWFDNTVGELLQNIDNRGMTDNTIVVYVSDNGWIQNPDGNGFKWPSKQSPYDMGIRTHITYKWPGQITPAIDTTNFVSSIDIVPTVLGALGLLPTTKMQGLNVLNPSDLHGRNAIGFFHILDSEGNVEFYLQKGSLSYLKIRIFILWMPKYPIQSMSRIWNTATIPTPTT